MVKKSKTKFHQRQYSQQVHKKIDGGKHESTHDAHTLGARTSMDFNVSSRRKADVSENPVAT